MDLVLFTIQSPWAGPSQVALMVKKLPANAGESSVQSMEKGMATHSIIPARRMSWTEEAGELQSIGSEQSFGLCGRGRGQNDMGEWH